MFRCKLRVCSHTVLHGDNASKQLFMLNRSGVCFEFILIPCTDWTVIMHQFITQDTSEIASETSFTGSGF